MVRLTKLHRARRTAFRRPASSATLARVIRRTPHAPASRLRGSRRRALSPEFQLVSRSSQDASPLHARIYRDLRDHILSGGLQPGARIPSARSLAADLKVSRNTIESAVAQLVAEGFVERRIGSGTVVASSLADVAPFAKRGGARATEKPAAAATHERDEGPRTKRGQLILKIGGPETQGDRLTSASASDAGFFPWQRWTKVTAQFARKASARALGAASPAGLRELREEIAKYVNLSRGLSTTGDMVVIVSSTQQAVDLCARVLLDPGDIAIVEEPGYPSARGALLASGARVMPIAVDDEGLDVAALPGAADHAKTKQKAKAQAQDASPRLVYLTPSQQFPLGGTMSLARRLALLAWARDTRAWIVEDDCDREFWYDGRPIAALHGLDRAGRVIYLGTFNKALFPGLRLAYMIVPQHLVPTFTAARRLADGFSPSLPQLVLADFMKTGHFTASLRQARHHYNACRDALVGGIQEHWGKSAHIGPASAGLHLTVHLNDAADDAAIASAAPAHGLGVTPLSRYYAMSHPKRGLLLNFGATDPAAIRAAVKALAPAVRRG